MKLSVFGDDPVIKHLVGILSHSIIDLCNRMQPSIFFNPMSEILRGVRPGLFDDYWFSFLSHSLVLNQIFLRTFDHVSATTICITPKTGGTPVQPPG